VAVVHIAPELLAELGHEVRKFDEADVRAAPKMVVDLGYGGNPQACISLMARLMP
jgi:hypothetical protein